MSTRLRNLLVLIGTSVVVSLGAKACIGHYEGGGGGEVPISSEGPASVRVAFAGIEPRDELRLAVEEGHREEVAIGLRREVRTTEGQSFDAGPAGLVAAETGGVDLKRLRQSLGVPPDGTRELGLVLELEVESFEGDRVTVEWEVARADVRGATDPAWDEAVAGLERLRGTTVLRRTGETVEASMLGARWGTSEQATLNHAVRRLMAEPAPVLPQDEVGHGAVWEVTREVTDGAVVTEQVQRYEVTELGRTVELRERARAELVRAGRLGASVVEVGMVGLDLDGVGSWSLDPARVVATGEASSTTASAVSMGLGLATVELVTITTLELVVEGR